MNVLIACEESQTICLEFRKLGHVTFSNDILHFSVDHPEWYLMMDTREACKIKK